jgi:polysaccharide biosynthesis/export protein
MSDRAPFAWLLVTLACLAVQAGPALAQPLPPPSARIAAPPAPAAPAMASYVLGPEDVVEVDVLGRADFKTRARVRQDGTIQLPLVGALPAADRTALQLSAQVAQALINGGYFPNPIVSVDIVSYASRYVTVLGQVGTPGLVPVDRAYRLSEILARVGGVRESGSEFLVLTNQAGEQRRYSISELASGVSQDPFVSPGDKIFSPPADTFFINGQVNSPGQFRLKPGMTVSQAIAQAGGLTQLGTNRGFEIERNGVKIRRLRLTERLRPDDVVIIKERFF